MDVLVYIATVYFGATEGFPSWLGTLVENVLEFIMDVPAWSKVFLGNLAFKYQQTILGSPYQFNGMKICLGMTLVAIT